MNKKIELVTIFQTFLIVTNGEQHHYTVLIALDWSCNDQKTIKIIVFLTKKRRYIKFRSRWVFTLDDPVRRSCVCPVPNKRQWIMTGFDRIIISMHHVRDSYMGMLHIVDIDQMSLVCGQDEPC
jgi:hypothetical protein